MHEPPQESGKLRRSFLAVAAFVCLLWVVLIAEVATGVNLGRLGVYPQRLDGLAGLLLAPLVHGSWTHLFANTGPLLVLGTALLYGYPRAARIVLPVIYVGAGVLVWLFARPAYHIGSSGLTFGMFFFLFTIGVLRWDPRAIALALVVIFLYGSMVWGVLPHDPSVSHETHMAAGALGIALAFALRWRDPPPPRKRYEWEGEDQDEAFEEDEPTPDPSTPTGPRLH